MYNDDTRPSGWYLLIHRDGRRERLPIVAWDMETYRAERDDPGFEGHPNAVAAGVAIDGGSLVTGMRLDGFDEAIVHGVFHAEHAPEPRPSPLAERSLSSNMER